MIEMQSPSFVRSLWASSAPMAMRPTSVVVLRGVVAGSWQLAGRSRSSTEPSTSAWRSSSAPCFKSMPFRFAPTRPIMTSPAENRNGAMRTTPGRPAETALDVVHLLEVGVTVGLDDQVRVERQHLVLELALEAARHAEHDDQRRDPEHDTHGRHRREHREHAQQEGDQHHQPSHENADDARGLEEPVPVLWVGDRKHHRRRRRPAPARPPTRSSPSANAARGAGSGSRPGAPAPVSAARSAPSRARCAMAIASNVQRVPSLRRAPGANRDTPAAPRSPPPRPPAGRSER